MRVSTKRRACIELATQNIIQAYEKTVYFESKALWFDQVQWLAIDSDEALTFCAQGNSGGGFLKSSNKKINVS